MGFFGSDSGADGGHLASLLAGLIGNFWLLPLIEGVLEVVHGRNR